MHTCGTVNSIFVEIQLDSMNLKMSLVGSSLFQRIELSFLVLRGEGADCIYVYTGYMLFTTYCPPLHPIQRRKEDPTIVVFVNLYSCVMFLLVCN